MKPCEEYFESIIEYAHGDGAELSSEQRAALEAHLGECQACRTELKSAQEFLAVVHPSADTVVPVEVARCLHSEVMKAVRRRQMARVLWEKTSHPRVACSFLIAIAAGFATFAIWSLITDVGHSRTLSTPRFTRIDASRSAPHTARSAHPPGIAAPLPIRPPVPLAEQDRNKVNLTKPQSLTVAYQHAKSSSEALSILRSVYEDTQSTRADLDRAIELAREFPQRWPDSRESLMALHLVAQVYTLLADLEHERAAFIEFAEAAAADRLTRSSERHNSNPHYVLSVDVSSTLLGKVSDLVQTGEHVAALSYCDEILTRYSGSLASFKARMYVASCYEKTRQPLEALKHLRAIAEDSMNSDLAKEAWRRMARLHFNRQAPADGIAALQQLASRFSDDPEAVDWARFRIGFHLFTQGQESYPAALTQLQSLLRDSPKGHYADDARRIMRRMNDTVVRSIQDQLSL